MQDHDAGDGSTPRKWFDRLTDAFAHVPRTRSEFVKLLKLVKERSLIEAELFSIIEGALAVSDIKARDIMVPRSQCTFIHASANLSELLEVVTHSGHSRFPVLGESVDTIKGVLHAKDLFPLLINPTHDDGWFDCLRTAKVIPEGQGLTSLLREFRLKRDHMAVVIDEYSHIAGLVTIEDVLEQIVGEIADEHDIIRDEPKIHPIQADQEDTYRVDATTPLSHFNQYFETELNHNEYETIGGMVLHHLGHLPEEGETLEIENMNFTVLEADGRRIHTLRLEMKEPPSQRATKHHDSPD